MTVAMPRPLNTRLLMSAVGVMCITAAAVLLGLRAGGYFDTLEFSTPDTGTAFNVGALVHPGTPLATPAAATDGSPVARLLIPSIHVDAPVVVKGVGADGAMEVPDNARDVAWYDFAARPGAGGNVVFSGHVDFHGVGPAVFWNLGKLRAGDLVRVRLADGADYDYRVTGAGTFDADTAPVDQIVGPTPGDAVTIITCTGTFNPRTRQYDRRLVVRAERADTPAAGASPTP